jgi:YggT family protein
MIALLLLTFIDLFVEVFNLLLIIRVVMSYVAKPGNPFYGWLVGLTEPLLAPVRRVLPATAGIDWAPVAVFFLLQGLQYLAGRLIGA